jgi:hypothetical protein
MKTIIKLFIPLLLFCFGCTKNNSVSNSNEPTTIPQIISLTALKSQILYGGNDPAYITCNAIGGNLKYVWEVDLGDIIPLNSDHSKISFNGAACCVGEKIIKCTVSNDKGSDTKSIIITILEVLKAPEIISIESDKTEINSNGESAILTCFAIGGQLKYNWQSDCGNISINGKDSSKIIYSASKNCIGTQIIKCNVSNEKGNDSKTFQITVKN